VRRLALAALLLAACSRGPSGPYAVIETSKGRMVARLYADAAPKTVAHLRALAEGSRPWRDPKTGKLVSRPLYDGTVFHRVVPGGFIQGGDPAGTGDGDPAAPVPDELRPGARFDRPGLLGMASWGPGTSQTQFFITLAAQPDLDGQYTLFGELVEGLDVAKAIAAVPRDEKGGDRPYDPPTLKSLRVVAGRPGMK
jgi:peptidyl-prolyl cis-trans isomerase A (cyclophilin A)